MNKDKKKDGKQAVNRLPYDVSLVQAARELLDLDEAIRGHLGRKAVSSQTAEGAKLWFQVLEQMRTNEALLKEQLRKILNYPKGTL